jgi:capsular polysaccharide biosynthesis protein
MLRLVILRVFESYFRHRWLYLLPIILMLGIAGVSIFGEPLYLAKGILYVEQESYLSSLISIQDSSFSIDTAADQTRREIADLLQTDAFVRAVIQETSLEEYMDQGETAVEKTMDEVRKAVWTDVPGSNQVRVAAEYKDPQVAYDLVNAVIDDYTQWKINANRAASVTAKAFFDDLIKQYQSDLETARRELENYLVAHPEPVRGSRTDVEALAIERLRSDLEFVNSRYVETLKLKDDVELSLTQVESDVRQTYYFIDSPRVPKEPETSLSDIATKIVIFTVTGIVLSLIGIIGSMLLDRSFRFPIDVQYGVDLPVIASIPNIEAN